MQVDDVAAEYERVKNNRLPIERAIQYAQTQKAQCMIEHTGMFDEEALGRDMGSYSRSNKSIEWLCIIAGKRMHKKADPGQRVNAGARENKEKEGNPVERGK